MSSERAELSANVGALAGRTAVVTGAASGIGLAIAERLAEEGAAVVIVDRDREAAAEVAAKLNGRYTVVDLSDPDAVDGLDLKADILVNNAGLQHVAPIEDFDPRRFATMLRLMLETPFRLVRQVLPGMYSGGWGRVVHVSSVHGQRASAYKSAYVAAKHGIEGLSKVIALEGAPHGVTSNTVAPGYVRTPLVEGQIAAQAQAHGIPEGDVVDQVMLSRTPVRRLIEPGEVAAAVAFLCGPGSSSITGSSFVIDGGWTAS